MRDYYLLIDGQQVGPYTPEQLHERLAQGELTSESPAWYDGLPDWAQLGTILEDVAPSVQSPVAPSSTALRPAAREMIHAASSSTGSAAEVLPIATTEEPAQVISSQPVAPIEAQAPIVITITKSKLLWGACAVGFLLFLFVIYYVATPFYALHVLRSAIRTGDSDALESHIDFPALRESLKQEMKAQMMGSMSKDTSLFSGLAEAMAPSIIDSQIDSAVTPSGTLKYLSSFAGGIYPPEPISTFDFPIEHTGFDSPTDFRFTCLGNKFHMHYYGIGWKIYRLEMLDHAATADKVGANAADQAVTSNTAGDESDPGYIQAFKNATMQQTRQIGECLFSYATDHGGNYPDGKSSTEVFQKLIDESYVTDPSIFYIRMTGKTKAVAGQRLKPENVCFDLTSPVDNSSPDNLPIGVTSEKVLS